MMLKLTSSEITFLKNKKIDFKKDYDYSKEEAFSLLEQVYEVETVYADGETKVDLRLASIYADIADKIQSQIPE
ncbi:MAG TPA: hypothetical protein GXX72_05760 [Clostridiaceae bacterium]|nr:hypothetical protein [Clostridiaceae bacterium]